MNVNPRCSAAPKLLNWLVLGRVAPGVLLALLALQGCGRFRPHIARNYVYVWVKDMDLRDRVAPVNTRVARVVNGDRLQLLERDGRFLKVKAPDGKVGWIADQTIIDQATYDKFAELAKENAHAPVLAHGILREYYWMRDAPGRESDRFYLLHRNQKLELLRRASVPKPEAPGVSAKPGAPPDLEDYWLARDAAGHVGWVWGRTLDEDVPQDVELLAIGEKVLEARVLRTVTDPDSDRPNHEVPEYVVALAPWKDGLPWDFDQLRVFTWNVRRHRWETAWRDHDLEGFLPITVSQQAFDGRTEPVFSFRAATGGSARIDPKTGFPEAGTSATETYRLDDTLVRKVSGPELEPVPGAQKKMGLRQNRRHGRGR